MCMADRIGDQLTDSNASESTGTDGLSSRSSSFRSDTDLLKDIDATLNDILNSMGRMSQSNARNMIPTRSKWATGRTSRSSVRGGNTHISSKGFLDDFTDGITEALLDSLGASDFKKRIQDGLKGLADSMNVSLDVLPREIGNQLGQYLSNTGPGKMISSRINEALGSFMDNVSDAFNSGKSSSSMRDAIKNGWNHAFGGRTPSSGDVSEVANAARNSGSNVISFPGSTSVPSGTSTAAAEAEMAQAASTSTELATVGETAGMAGSEIAGLASSAAAACPYILAIIAALIVIDQAMEAVEPAINSFVDFVTVLESAGNRYQTSSKKNLEEAQKRLQADAETMVRKPFQILEEAATSLYQVWDNQLKTISATQGYTKADVQDLMSVYAQRLRSEGLSSVVSGADIMTNLSKVLESGMSGKVAEEFSYMATKLEAAVPTQDFFSYASTYASVAANAIAAGKSQSEAIELANQEMEAFASNLLYASRELSGGFSSGLKDAASLFEDAVKIATTSRTGDASQISGVLTAVSAVAGSIAPDLASGLVDAVVKAATGGNSSELVALRSLSGVNASNTEFLRALANDPQGIFEALFSNLAKLQNMSNDNFMEVAEGLSSIFGVSMDAFARVDFNYLAQQIANMNVNNSSLEDNIKLLADGQTTTSEEQLKMAQINKYMIDEGLSYVLDNDAARSIQEHMWQEQIARELQESTYAIDLQGKGLELLQGILTTADNIVNFLNPFSYLKNFANIAITTKEAQAMKGDIKRLLEAGKVGQGNALELYRLTTTNQDLHLIPDITTLMGAVSFRGGISLMDRLFNNFTNTSGLLNQGSDLIQYYLRSQYNSSATKSPTSVYRWANVGKSASRALSAIDYNATGLPEYDRSATSTADLAKQRSNQMLQKFLDTMKTAVSENKSYSDWTATAKNFGIKNLSDAFETAGITESDLKGAFANQEAQKASEYTHNRQVNEDEFWKQATSFYLNTQQPWLDFEQEIADNQTAMIAELVKANTELTNIWSREDKFFTEYLADWRNYYVKHTAYSESTLDSYKAADIIKSEKKENGDAVLALANALTQNTIGIQEGFKDPVVQTNVLLAKILIVAEAIMQQNNKTGGVSLADSLSALGLGITTPSV